MNNDSQIEIDLKIYKTKLLLEILVKTKSFNFEIAEKKFNLTLNKFLERGKSF